MAQPTTQPSSIAPRTGDFRLKADADARGKAMAAALELPDGGCWEIPAGTDLGAFQGGDLYPPLEGYGG